ncbi:undecaprenyl-diphosphatase UppP [Candidatus Uhrbacteria bacterium CG_4_9_14_0_2_um_filter_41_50]|uniref:Undecaprenyl-diphosphatase n=1 Tax=Candidatus Uhrbacteria bacterium CG_4_9_14_0_2_um_filter_41_50 TaxID=1975031 RepID=A0A2M8EPA2_9BACT|nr:MAG: undecaprenyl-diphosphatase UppP [Candidatus Uhrbacteria bacterium CG_4_10_14_3_um_filter_41_21]PIZ54607.1 MAG: undecaprenyl-diphosphatase UppP [Candidatus Uhrbacteria bacterium CG_4_10_14_0_2_um_filter_41_21]PJB84248.1 MAG: undecaprenyl-diphosphatase UppP [Candidatus Uhrbacteria bacterium CG_4_9_14_0_8_um_filter_41_16]PJC24575.1 MAG: undecaprenyl-diphosphatase UppP [Candidatus Uhrbacteria bacterium CG_4_9_14_0_2_um_filter_41_50]PJE74876.1 MAG: undecaprenyl-diphosphatase UppP [Candidatus
MSYIEAIILGIVQGVTEFLPISSSGHLILLHDLFDLEQESFVFDVGLHIATLAAVIWFFRDDIKIYINEFFKNPKNALLTKIFLATIPIGIVGVFFGDKIIELTHTMNIIAFSLIFWGILLIAADFFTQENKKSNSKEGRTTWLQSIFIGLLQIVALVPGTSRSGITMTAGMFSGLDRRAAARFSFLLSIPAIAGAGLVSLKDIAENGMDVNLWVLLSGMISAFIVGWFSITFLLNLINKSGFIWFGIYRIALGLILLLWFL